jgi:hypothetical protein
MVFDLVDNDANFIYVGEQRMINGASYFLQFKLKPIEGSTEYTKSKQKHGRRECRKQ